MAQTITDRVNEAGAVQVRPRPFPAVAERVLIIGLDGATFDVLNPLMAEGRMPRLAGAVTDGASGVLHSTVPPITPAAWTTFLTGTGPGRHGILDFERYDVATNTLQFNSTRVLGGVRNLWQILGDWGLRVGSINVPMTYPPVPVNGFLISGFETPGPDSDFVYPPELKNEILERWRDPTLGTRWRHATFGGSALFEENVAYMSRSFHQGADMTTTLGDRLGWDVLMVVLKLVDNLQHKTWKHIDPRWSSRSPRRAEIVKRAFGELDKAVGALLDYAAGKGAAVLIVSDHGHGSLEGKVQPNLLLRDWGYLKLESAGSRALARVANKWNRLGGRRRKFVRGDPLKYDCAVDFSATRACVMHAGMAGFLYVNLRGRQPCGVVAPQDYESLRDELEARFLSPDCQGVDPRGNTINLFKEVLKPEALYGCTRDEQPWMPDLILVPHESLAAVRKIRGSRPVQWLPYRRIEGTHRPEGILIAAGPGIARGRSVEANIVDCAPTLLVMLGMRIPDDMQGRVVEDLFEEPPVIGHESVRAAERTEAGGGEAYSEQELAEVTARLTDLGYLQ